MLASPKLHPSIYLCLQSSAIQYIRCVVDMQSSSFANILRPSSSLSSVAALSPSKCRLPPTMKHISLRFRGKLCEIFKFWSFLQSKSVNNVCKLLQLLDCVPRPLLGLRPWAPLGSSGEADIVYRFWLQKRLKLKISHNSLPEFWRYMFHGGG